MRFSRYASLISWNALLSIVLSVFVLFFLLSIFFSLFLDEETNFDVAQDDAESIRDFIEHSNKKYSGMSGCYTLMKLETLTNFQSKESSEETYVYLITDNGVEIYPRAVFDELRIPFAGTTMMPVEHFTGGGLTGSIDGDTDSRLTGYEPEEIKQFSDEVQIQKISRDGFFEKLTDLYETFISDSGVIHHGMSILSGETDMAQAGELDSIELENSESILLVPNFPETINLFTNQNLMRGVNLFEEDEYYTLANTSYLAYNPGENSLFLTAGTHDERHIRDNLCRWSGMLTEIREDLLGTQDEMRENTYYEDVVSVDYEETDELDWKLRWVDGNFRCDKLDGQFSNLGKTTITFSRNVEEYEITYDSDGDIHKVNALARAGSPEIANPIERGPFKTSNDIRDIEPRENLYDYIVEEVYKGLLEEGDGYFIDVFGLTDEETNLEFDEENCVGVIGEENEFDTCGGELSISNKEEYRAFQEEYNKLDVSCSKIEDFFTQILDSDELEDISVEETKEMARQYFHQNVEGEVNLTINQIEKSDERFIEDLLLETSISDGEIHEDDLDDGWLSDSDFEEEYGEYITVKESDDILTIRDLEVFVPENECFGDLCEYALFRENQEREMYFYDGVFYNNFVRFNELLLQKEVVQGEEIIYFMGEEVDYRIIEDNYENVDPMHQIEIPLPSGDYYQIILSNQQFERIPPK